MHALARRAFVGLHISKAPEGSSSPGEPGLYVAAVLAESAAERAGVHAGDFLLALGGERIRDAGHLVDVARALRASARVAFRVHRDGATLDVAANAPPLPIEQVEGCEVELSDVMAGAHRLRTIVTIPRAPGPHPAILYLQGVRGQSCEHPLEPENPTRRLVDGWAQRGSLVFRVERSGVGDSEGPPPSRTGLGVELDGYDAALDMLLSRPDVDRARVFLFGQSFGGMIAPLVALDRSLAGVMVFGTSAARWHDCIVATGARQQHLKGHDEVRAAEETRRWSELHSLVCREGWTPAEAFERRPHLATLRSRDCNGETLYGRHVSLFRELDATDLTAAWRALGEGGTPVLVVHGEYDWVCSREEGEAIAAAAGERCTRFAELPGIGHDLLAHGNLTDSFAHAGRGRWDGRVVAATGAWMREIGAGQTKTSSQPPGKTHP